MKKLFIPIAVIAITTFIFSGCSKDDDTESPVITILGDNPYKLAVGSTFNATTDPGATASDNNDGDLTGDLVADYSGLDVNVAGEYEVHYEVADKADNLADEHRLMYVTHTGSQLAGITWAVDDTLTSSGTTINLTYQVNTLVSSSTFRALIDGMSDGFFTNSVYMDMEANRITIPTQTPNGAGSGKVIEGSGTISRNLVSGVYTMRIEYTITDTSNPTQTASGVYISQ